LVKLAVDAVAAANEELQGVAGHPGGAEGVASIVAVFDLDGVFFWGWAWGWLLLGGFVCGKRRGFWVLDSFRFSFGDDSFSKSNMAVIGGCSGVDPAVLGLRIRFFLWEKRMIGVEMLQDRPSFADAPHTGWDEEMWRRCSWG
jgi:hypothetical protein